MFTLHIGPAFDPIEVLAAPTTTIRELFKENHVNITTSTILTLNARRLGDAELDMALGTIGVSDGDLITTNDKLSSN